MSTKPIIISASPHVHSDRTSKKLMYDVVIALIPAFLVSLYVFGIGALIVTAVAVISCILFEFLIQKYLLKAAVTINDGSALLTGILLAFNLPSNLPIWMIIVGSLVAIGVAKMSFGGLGKNIFNPALLGRAFLQASFPVAMTTWTYPQTDKFASIDAVTAATPLGMFKFEKVLTGYYDLLIGNIGGSLGETSALAVLIGGVFLLVRKYADWRIPLSYMGTVLIITGIFWLAAPQDYADPVFHLLSGGLMLGAFFMATDMVTSPITPRGSYIFGIGAGVILVVIRLFGGVPEGVMYSILLMNAFTPIINRKTRPKIFGEVSA